MVPIPYRDAEDLEAFGCAGFLRMIRTDDGDAYLGALFLVNARGEPVEFTYSRLEPQRRFLWRRVVLDRYAVRRLAASLFDVCPRLPTVLLCLGDEVPPEVLADDLQVSVPVARVAGEEALIGQARGEERESLGGPSAVQVFWLGGVPTDDAPERRLVTRLAERGLLLEPFERAALGLREVFHLSQPADDDELVDGPGPA
jgi:hypothetical protein